jgi:hypothetical protein
LALSLGAKSLNVSTHSLPRKPEDKVQARPSEFSVEKSPTRKKTDLLGDSCWYILLAFGPFYGHFAVAILWPFGIFMVISYIFSRSVTLYQEKSGTEVMIFKIFSPKYLAKMLAFFAQNRAKF